MADQTWGDYTDEIITEVDSRLGKKYSMTVRAFLSNPGKYSNLQSVDVVAGNMKEDVDKILDEMDADLKSERQALNDALSKIDAMTSQLSQNISMQAKQNKTPLVRPEAIVRDETDDVVLYLSTLEDGAFPLVEKLATTSKFIVDYGTTYDNYKIGAWLFSGEKNYILRVYLPPNEAMTFADSKAEIDDLFGAAASAVH